MRKRRLKIQHKDATYSTGSRTAGGKTENLLDEVEKEYLRTLFARYAKLYGVRVISLQVMGTHWHAELAASGFPMRKSTVCRRKNRYDRKRLAREGRELTRPMTVDDEDCERYQYRLVDISSFVQQILHDFSVYYNKRHRERGGGTLWATRFYSTLTLGNDAFRRALLYILTNPLNAGIEPDGKFGSYRFSSFVLDCKDPPPLSAALLPHLRMHLPPTDRTLTDDELRQLIVQAAYAYKTKRDIEREVQQTGTTTRKLPPMPILLLPTWDHVDWDEVFPPDADGTGPSRGARQPSTSHHHPEARWDTIPWGKVRMAGTPEEIREATAQLDPGTELTADYIHPAYPTEEKHPVIPDGELAVYTGSTRPAPEDKSKDPRGESVERGNRERESTNP